MAFWSKKDNGRQVFCDLIRGLQYSVNAAMEMLEARNIELLSRYFTEEGSPRLRRLNLNENTAVDIPVISVVNPSALKIKEVEMEFEVHVSSLESLQKEPQRGFLANEKNEDLNISMERSNLEISFNGTPDQNTMKVKIKFESSPIPEGMSRIIEEYDKTIIPFERGNE
jgi:hypothetical protein